MAKRVSLPAATLLLVTLPYLTGMAPVFAQGKKPAAKPPTKTGVKSATQMAGDNGQIGQNYMIGGKGDELVFTLTGAEYIVSRVQVGVDNPDQAIPKGDEKVLLLRYSVQNPQKSDIDFNRESFVITAVDAKDINHVASFVGRQGTNEPVGLQLKPAQKLDVFTAITVPATGPVPKLIIQRGSGTPVLRYDLKGKVKPLAAPFADPKDASGATARPEVTGAIGTFYPIQSFDARLDGTGYTTGPIEGQEVEEGKRFFTATITLKNPTISPLEYAAGALKAELILASGEKVEVSATLLRANRDEPASGTLKTGETVTVRLFAQIPTSDNPKTLRLQETEESRIYVFDVAGSK
jgi:hypothetical protein